MGASYLRCEPSRENRIRVGELLRLRRFELSTSASFFGVTDTPRKTNYDFERREREKSKAADTAAKVKAKADKRASQIATPDEDSTTDR